MSTFKRTKLLLRVLCLLLCLLLSACGSAGKQPNWLGAINYQAPLALLEVFDTEDGEMLEYRELKSLRDFMTHTSEPIVLCVRQKNDYAAPTVIPMMESWAVEYRAKAAFVFADAESDDPLLGSLAFTHTPTFFLIVKSAVLMKASWQEENALLLMESALRKTLGLQEQPSSAAAKS